MVSTFVTNIEIYDIGGNLENRVERLILKVSVNRKEAIILYICWMKSLLYLRLMAFKVFENPVNKKFLWTKPNTCYICPKWNLTTVFDNILLPQYYAGLLFGSHHFRLLFCWLMHEKCGFCFILISLRYSLLDFYSSDLNK